MTSSGDDYGVAEFVATYGTPIYECGEEAPLRTSWTKVNPGRRFYGCPFYGTPRGRCRYFVWVDPEFPETAKNVINALLRKSDRLEKEKKALEKRHKMMIVGKLFVWVVVIITVCIPVVCSWCAKEK